VHVTVNYATVSSRRIVIDQALARQLFLALTDLKHELGLGGQVDLSDRSWNSVRSPAWRKMSIMSKTSGQRFKRLSTSLVANLEAMRLAEGEHWGVISFSVFTSSSMAGADQKAASPPSSSTTAKIEARISRLFGDVEIDPARLAQEVCSSPNAATSLKR